MSASVRPARPFEPSMVDDLNRLAEQLRGQAKPTNAPAVPMPGGDPALLEASADAATLLARLLDAALAFDNGQEATAEKLIVSTRLLMQELRPTPVSNLQQNTSTSEDVLSPRRSSGPPVRRPV